MKVFLVLAAIAVMLRSALVALVAAAQAQRMFEPDWRSIEGRFDGLLVLAGIFTLLALGDAVRIWRRQRRSV